MRIFNRDEWLFSLKLTNWQQEQAAVWMASLKSAESASSTWERGDSPGCLRLDLHAGRVCNWRIRQWQCRLHKDARRAGCWTLWLCAEGLLKTLLHHH